MLSLALILLVSCTEDSPRLPIEVKLQNILDSKVGIESDLLVGVAVSIRVGQEERWNLVSGDSKLGVPIRSNMRFGIGSITKTMIAATALYFTEINQLKLDDTIGDWLTTDNINIDESITVSQLLNHTSGLGEYLFNEEMWTSAKANTDVPIPLYMLLQYVDSPVSLPGAGHHYSNTNYLLLGLILEQAGANDLGDILRQNVFTPHGLESAYYGASENVSGEIANPWRDEDFDGDLDQIEYSTSLHSIYNASGDVFSTASDISRWSYALFNGYVISPQSLEQMLTFIPLDENERIGYGLGIRKNKIAGLEVYGHTGSMHGYGAYMFFEPQSQISIALLNNQSRSENGEKLRLELVEEILKELIKEGV